MVLSISLTFLSGVGLALLLRNRFLRAGSAIVAALFGYSLASTGLAPGINNAITSIAHWAGTLH